MSMHLEKAWLTTSRFYSKPKNKTKSQLSAEKFHNGWLIKMGIKPKGKGKISSVCEIPTYVAESTLHSPSSELIPTWTPNSRKVPVFENLRSESPETQSAILEKSSRVAPAYNKGAYQYIPNKEDLKTAGRKRFD